MTAPTLTDSANTVNPIASGGTGSGLWIRVAANLSRRKVTWRLAESCLDFPVPDGAPRSLMRHAAMGFLQELWGNIAEHTVDGVIAPLPDAQLEQWAGWDGAPGVFASWLRAKHLDLETGCVRQWDEFAGALQSKREKDAQRQREKRDREKRERLARAQMVAPAATLEPTPDVLVLETAPIKPPSSPYRVALTPDEITDLARRATIALNKGMSENVKMGERYMPVHAGRGDSVEFITYLAGEGVVHWELVDRIVYTIAKGYEPVKLGDQIRSLTFCREKALAMYRRALARAEAERAGPIAELPSTKNGRKGTTPDAHREGRVARSAAGAMAAAAAVGLAE